MKLKEKYIFRKYNPVFPQLFEKEKERLLKELGENIQIEHIGSTAVPGLGGKGVIDISVAASKNDWGNIADKLAKLGYEYKKKDPERESQKLFFMADLPDEELGTRIYHIHLSYPESTELKKEIFFRDYLKSHPKELKEYADIKKIASQKAQQLKTKDEMRDLYGNMKKEFIENVIKKMDS